VTTPDSLSARITDYLSSGGLFNPEMMDHDNVRDLLIEIREFLDKGELKSAYAALDAIDLVVSDDFCEDLDMRVAFDPENLSPDLLAANAKISQVYKIAHSESPNHCCYQVHDDWREIKHQIL
jgi:hypothetical protein